MRGKTIRTIVFILLACLFAACHRGQTSGPSIAPSPPPPDTRPCVANITVVGSAFSGRTIKTFQDFSDVTKEAAFNQILTTLQTNGLTIDSANEQRGVITSWKYLKFSKGGIERLNVVVRNKGAAGIRVELIYLTPTMTVISEGALHYSFCKIMEDVQSARMEPQAVPPAPPEPSEPERRIVYVKWPTASLREGPGTNFKAIAEVKKGTSLAVLDEKDQWVLVRLEDGTEGWIGKATTAETP